MRKTFGWVEIRESTKIYFQLLFHTRQKKSFVLVKNCSAFTLTLQSLSGCSIKSSSFLPTRQILHGLFAKPEPSLNPPSIFDAGMSPTMFPSIPNHRRESLRTPSLTPNSNFARSFKKGFRKVFTPHSFSNFELIIPKRFMLRKLERA